MGNGLSTPRKGEEKIHQSGDTGIQVVGDQSSTPRENGDKNKRSGDIETQVICDHRDVTKLVWDDNFMSKVNQYAINNYAKDLLKWAKKTPKLLTGQFTETTGRSEFHLMVAKEGENIVGVAMVATHTELSHISIPGRQESKKNFDTILGVISFGNDKDHHDSIKSALVNEIIDFNTSHSQRQAPLYCDGLRSGTNENIVEVLKNGNYGFIEVDGLCLYREYTPKKEASQDIDDKALDLNKLAEVVLGDGDRRASQDVGDRLLSLSTPSSAEVEGVRHRRLGR